MNSAPPNQPDQVVAPSDDIPNFLMLDQIPTNYVQQLETDLLEPVVFQQGTTTSDGFARFTLQNKGFLHSHSKIFLSIEPQGTTTASYLQPHVGIAQVIKKAVLKIGNKALNELDSWDALFAVKSSLITNENNIEREQYLTGRSLAHEFTYNAKSSQNASDYGLSNGMEYTSGRLNAPEWAQMVASKKNECPSFSIDLSDLFPFLKVNQLPLYMINEPINIELYFHPTIGKRLQIPSGQTVDQEMFIARDQLKFAADYIYYGASDEMARYAAANPDLSFSFVDYRLVEHSTDATALASGVVRNLGMANRMVPRVITLMVDTDTAAGETSILGSNNSKALSISADGVLGAVKYNIRYNDRFEYTSDVDNTSRLFSEFTNSEGIPFITRQEYSNAGSVAGGISSVDTYEGRIQDTFLSGHFFYMGSRLTNGRVGNRGLELFITADVAGQNVNLLRCYCEYIRVARLSNGLFDVFNA